MLPDPKELVQEALHKEANVRGFLGKLTSPFRRAARPGAPAMTVTPPRPRPRNVGGPFRSGPAGVTGRQAKPGTMARLDERSARKQAVIESGEYNKRRARMTPGFSTGRYSEGRKAKPGTQSRLLERSERRKAAFNNLLNRRFPAGPNPGQTPGPGRFRMRDTRPGIEQPITAASRAVARANRNDSLNYRRGVR